MEAGPVAPPGAAAPFDAAAEQAQAVAACVDGLAQPYDAARSRVQKALTELKEAQAAAGGALKTSRAALQGEGTVYDELQHAVGFIPIYMNRAHATAREMRALRARADKCVARAAKLQKALDTGEALVPTDLSVYAGAAAGVTSALVGWAGAAAANVSSAAAGLATAAVVVASGVESPLPSPRPGDIMEPLDPEDIQ